MVLKSPVQPLNKLFERSPFFRLDIKVLEPDNLFMLHIGAVFQGIQVVDACGIGGIAVGDENEFLVI